MRIINNQKWYKPREIAKLGLIQNSAGTGNVDSNYVYILKLIKTGRLPAKDYSVSQNANYWLVPESAINQYNKSFTKV
jgi:hypothetical protein